MPRRYVGAGLLFTDPDDNILLVETSYKDVYEIPGGVAEAGESPREAAQREAYEELGIRVEPGRMLIFDTRSQPPPKGDAIMIVFDGGVIDDPAALKPDGNEIVHAHFALIDQVEKYCTPRMATRLRAALAARARNTLIEIVDGKIIS